MVSDYNYEIKYSKTEHTKQKGEKNKPRKAITIVNTIRRFLELSQQERALVQLNSDEGAFAFYNPEDHETFHTKEIIVENVPTPLFLRI